MRLLHTSDWHLGRTLFGRKRLDEQAAFLDWLTGQLDEQAIDLLIVAGDIFDNTTPSNQAQELYYRFLRKASKSSCRHVIIVSGNHDSSSFLDAPGTLLYDFNIHVVGTAREDPQEEVLLLQDSHNQPELIVCAVPHLRDRDLRTVDSGESIEDKERKLVEGLRSHYHEVVRAAELVRASLDRPVPIVATGHLFTTGGQTTDEDGVRALYVGTLASVDAALFPSAIDYLALGHLHAAQCVQDRTSYRYSGSPIPLSFAESSHKKQVLVVEIADEAPFAIRVDRLDVPSFQRLERISGDLASIEDRLRDLVAEDESIWVEVIYTGSDVLNDLSALVTKMVCDSRLDVLRVRQTSLIGQQVLADEAEASLEQLTEDDVFERLLIQSETPVERYNDLRISYQEARLALLTDDSDRWNGPEGATDAN